MVQSYLDSGVLERVEKAPEFNFPTYLLYARERDTPELQQAFAVLREVIESDTDWSQRWSPMV